MAFGHRAFLDGAGEPEHPAGAGDATQAAASVQPAAAVDAGRNLAASKAAVLSQARETAIVEAVRRAIPSVVSVNVIRRERVVPRSFFEEFFVPYGYEREVKGLGSGFAIAPGGFVLTNAHVVQGATEIIIATLEGSDHPAELIGIDELSDLALLKAAVELPVPEFGDSQELVIGEPAIAIGNPLGYLISNVEPTVTAGVISGVGRHILPTAFGGTRDGGEAIYADMIQTDASINPGNSGGPLVNAEGKVVGVNSTIFSRSGGSQGLGFAIPINRALRIAESLRARGEVRRPWVGLDVGPAERDRAGRRRGAAITQVAAGSPAERAKLEAGMELVAVDGRPVRSNLDWEAELLDVSPGQTLQLTIRDARGREREVRLVAEELPSVRAARVEVLSGLELTTLTPAIRAERGLQNPEGALIVGVSDYVTRMTGLRKGDLIVEINRARVTSADDVAEALDYLARRGATVRVIYERGGRLWRTLFRLERG